MADESNTTETQPPEGVREEELEPGILRWLLDSPRRRNAISPAVFDWISERCGSLAGEVVIIRGSGDDAFSAGFDLTALATELQASKGPPDLTLIRATRAMQAANATFLASLNGYVIGAAVELVSACDLRIAREGASLRLPAGRLGVVYHAAGLARIHAAFGGTIARRLLLVGEKVPIEDARASLCGLVPAAELDGATLETAQYIRQQSSISVAGNRRLLRALDRVQSLPADLLESHQIARQQAYQTIAGIKPEAVRET
ncbi:Enoyl-CoA hydratase/isomerase [Plesiocystis pacifica SIR-1]|uniref:Enoyl-CoA hydratase/isomerase n=1 Tax=Plesiocystis pacifica SIR-1 TaxID=391625 RepID=A6GFC8_9BACT|nr:enoyl-CoA hydratase/isomerase family protein [Plesiocystis pacifica]EDM75413.1 Enoyl-CoA hydratase/isomerase [Plesiocystis pacifica SIR-1]